jgi:hypothetical protein
MRHLLLLLLLATPMEHTPSRASIPGLSAEWSATDDELLVTSRGETTGWVLVGFNGRDELRGSRLFFGRVIDGTVLAEEHLADPPRHSARPGASVRVVGGSEGAGVTTVTLGIPRGEAAGVSIAPGVSTYLTLAWSQSDDLDHHSARREAMRLVL